MTANVKFSQLPNLTSITANTIIPVVAAGTNYTVTTANLQTYVNGGTGNITTGNLSATGNITGSYILGNGSQLTGLPATYTNSNVITLLAAFGSNTISTTGSVTTGNITAGNLSVSGTTTLNPYIETTAASVNSSTSFTPVMSNGPVQKVTATANFTLAAPTGMVTGQSITLIIRQDATGSRIMTPNAAYKFAYGVNTLSTAANSIDMLSIFYDGTNYLSNLIKGYV